jgi:predicted enzyme related to lactoylglutathione lyase
MDDPTVGSIGWRDLTVDDAEGVRDFYKSVVGWKSSPVDMGGYSDFSMQDADGNVVAGICHARGANAGLPPQWLVYLVVADLGESIAACEEAGGEVVSGPRGAGEGRMCVIRDPAGAACALFEPGT